MRQLLDEAIAAVGRFGAERQKISRVGATIAERLNLPRRMPPSPIEVDARVAANYVPLPVSLLERMGIDVQTTPTRPTNYIG